MSDPVWRIIATVTIPADSGRLWTLAHPWVEGPGLIKIEVKQRDPEQTWKYGGDAACSADGDLMSGLDQRRCVLSTAPVGALIGRIGGSTADASGAFPVGRLCVRELPQSKAGEPATRGPLFLTINDVWSGFGDNAGSLEVQIFQAPSAITTTPAPPAAG